MTQTLRPELLTSTHQVDEFDCGLPPLNEWLQQRALDALRADTARTYVLAIDGRVHASYSLAASSVEPRETPDRVRKGTGRFPIPVILIARLAVDGTLQRLGVGAALLKDALIRIAASADSIGVRAALVHAKDERARGFYERYGFESSPTDPLHLLLLIKDLRASIGD